MSLYEDTLASVLEAYNLMLNTMHSVPKHTTVAIAMSQGCKALTAAMGVMEAQNREREGLQASVDVLQNGIQVAYFLRKGRKEPNIRLMLAELSHAEHRKPIPESLAAALRVFASVYEGKSRQELSPAELASLEVIQDYIK